MKNRDKWIIAGMVSVTFITLSWIYRSTIKKGTTLIKDKVTDKVWDLVSEGKIETLHPKIRDKARELVNRVEKELGIKIRVTSGFRTYAEQDKLYAQGRTNKGAKLVTNAQGGESNHNFGTALDVVPIVNGKPDWETTSDTWSKIGKIGKEIGFDWGGDWKKIIDKPHFEMQFGNTLAQLRKKYESGEKDGEYVKLA